MAKGKQATTRRVLHIHRMLLWASFLFLHTQPQIFLSAGDLFIKALEVSELRHEAVVPVLIRTGGCVLPVSLRWEEGDHPPYPFYVST